MKSTIQKKTWARGLALAALVVGVIWLAPGGSQAASPASDSKALFAAKCASCHGADGSGNTTLGTKLGARDLRSGPVQGESDGQLFNVITNGKGKMPAYAKSLSDEQRQQLVAHIRTLAR